MNGWRQRIFWKPCTFPRAVLFCIYISSIYSLLKVRPKIVIVCRCLYYILPLFHTDSPPPLNTHTHLAIPLYTRNRILITCDVLVLNPSTFVWVEGIVKYISVLVTIYIYIFLGGGVVHMYYVSILQKSQNSSNQSRSGGMRKSFFYYPKIEELYVVWIYLTCVSL